MTEQERAAATQEKCEYVIRKLVEIVNAKPDGTVFAIEADCWHGNTLTISIRSKDGGLHTHVGTPGGSFDELVDSLHGTLCENRGLSWA